MPAPAGMTGFGLNERSIEAFADDTEGASNFK
jgi:hypothetical protein